MGRPMSKPTSFDKLRVKHMLDPKNHAGRVQALDGFLFAVESLCGGHGLSATFAFDRIAGPADDPLEAVRQHVCPRYQYTLAPVEWRRELSEKFTESIFGVPLPPQARRDIVDKLLTLLARATQDCATAWRVETDPGSDYFHCFWMTYLFHTPRGLYLLHFATDD